MRSAPFLALVLALVPFAAFLAGCGGNVFTTVPSEDGGGVDAASVSADQACGDNAHDHCSKIATCSAELMTTTYGDEGTCETRLKLFCLNALAAPSTGATPASEEACAQAYATWSCDDYLNDDPPAACAQPKGSLAAGEPCGFAGQCETGFCAVAPGNTCGACAAVPQAGASCEALTTCGQLLVCESTTTQECQGFAPSGGTCGRGLPCAAGLFCVGSTSATTGTCEPAVEQVGASCDPTGKTGPGCDRLAGLTCNSLSRECATIAFAPTGGACGTVDDQTTLCAAAGTCGAASGPASGADASAGEICSPIALDGAECDLALGPFCRDPARCVVSSDAGTQGTCQFQTAASCQ